MAEWALDKSSAENDLQRGAFKGVITVPESKITPTYTITVPEMLKWKPWRGFTNRESKQQQAHQEKNRQVD